MCPRCARGRQRCKECPWPDRRPGWGAARQVSDAAVEEESRKQKFWTTLLNIVRAASKVPPALPPLPPARPPRPPARPPNIHFVHQTVAVMVQRPSGPDRVRECGSLRLVRCSGKEFSLTPCSSLLANAASPTESLHGSRAPIGHESNGVRSTPAPPLSRIAPFAPWVMQQSL